jgi:hypothetical protein
MVCGLTVLEQRSVSENRIQRGGLRGQIGIIPCMYFMLAHLCLAEKDFFWNLITSPYQRKR